MWKPTVVIALLSTATLAAGCGSSDSGDEPTTASGAATAATASTRDVPTNVAFLTYEYSEYQQAQEAGLQEAVAPTGGQVKVFNSQFDPQKMTSQCQDAISSGRYDVIVLLVLAPPTGIPCAAAAGAAGIPVVSMDSVVGTDPDDMRLQADGMSAMVGYGPKLVSEGMVAMVTEACAGKDPCKIIAEAIPNDPYTTSHAREVAERVPGAEVVQRINGEYDPAVVQKVMPDALSRNPDVDVFMAGSDSTAMAAVPAVEDAGLAGKVKITGAGASAPGVAAVQDGTLFGTLASWPRQVGRMAGDMAVELSTGTTPDPAVIDATQIDTPAYVTADSAGEFQAEWGPKGSG